MLFPNSLEVRLLVTRELRRFLADVHAPGGAAPALVAAALGLLVVADVWANGNPARTLTTKLVTPNQNNM